MRLPQIFYVEEAVQTLQLVCQVGHVPKRSPGDLSKQDNLIRGWQRTVSQLARSQCAVNDVIGGRAGPGLSRMLIPVEW